MGIEFRPILCSGINLAPGVNVKPRGLIAPREKGEIKDVCKTQEGEKRTEMAQGT